MGTLTRRPAVPPPQVAAVTADRTRRIAPASTASTGRNTPAQPLAPPSRPPKSTSGNHYTTANVRSRVPPGSPHVGSAARAPDQALRERHPSAAVSCGPPWKLNTCVLQRDQVAIDRPRRHAAFARQLLNRRHSALAGQDTDQRSDPDRDLVPPLPAAPRCHQATAACSLINSRRPAHSLSTSARNACVSFS